MFWFCKHEITSWKLSWWPQTEKLKIKSIYAIKMKWKWFSNSCFSIVKGGKKDIFGEKASGFPSPPTWSCSQTLNPLQHPPRTKLVKNLERWLPAGFAWELWFSYLTGGKKGGESSNRELKSELALFGDLKKKGHNRAKVSRETLWSAILPLLFTSAVHYAASTSDDKSLFVCLF